jgi:hypothetical protein
VSLGQSEVVHQFLEIISIYINFIICLLEINSSFLHVKVSRIVEIDLIIESIIVTTSKLQENIQVIVNFHGDWRFKRHLFGKLVFDNILDVVERIVGFIILVKFVGFVEFIISITLEVNRRFILLNDEILKSIGSVVLFDIILNILSNIDFLDEQELFIGQKKYTQQRLSLML